MRRAYGCLASDQSTATSARCRLAPIVGLESKLVSDPAPARPSLAVGLFGLRAGEHARGPAHSTDRIPLGPGIETVPVGFSGQSRPNLIRTLSLLTLGYFRTTSGLHQGYLDQFSRDDWGSPWVAEHICRIATHGGPQVCSRKAPIRSPKPAHRDPDERARVARQVGSAQAASAGEAWSNITREGQGGSGSSSRCERHRISLNWGGPYKKQSTPAPTGSTATRPPAAAPAQRHLARRLAHALGGRTDALVSLCRGWQDHGNDDRRPRHRHRRSELLSALRSRL